MIKTMEYKNTLGDRVGDTFVQFIPKNSKYTKYANTESNDFNYDVVNKAKTLY